MLFGKLRPYLAKALSPQFDGRCSSEFLVLRPTQISPEFLKYFCLSRAFIEAINASTYGAKMPRASWDFIGSYEIPVPDPSSQHAIVKFLERKTAAIDALIEKKRKLLELLAEKRAALINQAVTKGLDPNVPMKDSGIPWIGQIPAHWRILPVKNFSRISRGRFGHRPRNDPRLYDGPFPFLQTGDVAKANKYIEEFTQSLNVYGKATSKEFPAGTLVMAIAANVGDVAITCFSACFPDSIVGFHPSEEVSLEYLYYLFLGMRHALLETATENTQKNLNIERVGALLAPLPPVREQDATSEMLERALVGIEAVDSTTQAQIERLQEYRQAVITAAVTGQLDIAADDVVACEVMA